MTQYNYGDGRVWLQREKFVPYQLLLPYGMTGLTDPLGNLNAVREPSATKRGKSVIVDLIRAEPGLPQFQIETRLQKTFNYMLGLRDCAVNIQAHLGRCDRPDNYFASSMVLHMEKARRGDLEMDRVAKIEGEDNPIQMRVPWVAEVGPILFDLEAEFLSARTIAETEAATDIAFLESECLEDCRSQEDAGANAYLATKRLGSSAGNMADVWYTEDKGESWAKCVPSTPFVGGMDISAIAVMGTKKNHRVIVTNGTTRAGEHAQVAYADVTDMGTTAWVTAEVGSTDGEYILAMVALDWRHIYVTTDQGYVYMSEDGGATWASVYTSGAVDINAISGIGYGKNAGLIWAVGNSNLAIMSKDYGDSWTAVTGPSDGVGDDNTAVLVTPDGTAFVGNNAGELYGTFDDGDNWTTLSLQGVTPTAVDDIQSWGDADIFVAITTASGGLVLRSIDGGATFKLWSLNMPTNSGLNALAVVDPNIVFAVGEPHGGYAFVTRTISQAIGL